MKRYAIVLTNPTILTEGIEILKKEADVFTSLGPDEDSIIQSVNEHGAQAIFVRVEIISRRIFESCPTLKIVQEHGIGCDNIDLNAAADAGVMVLNIPGGTATAVSEHTVMMMFCLAHGILEQDRNAHQNGRFHPNVDWDTPFQTQLEGKNLFLVGLGNIGQKVAQKASGVGMNVGAYDQFVSDEKMSALGVQRWKSLSDGLRWADVVSLHAPLNDDTRHMISTPQFQIMKNSALLINCSRGGLVDEEALYQALMKKEIAAAGIDVFAEEPIQPTKNPLVSLHNVIVSPHCAGASLEGRARPAIWGAQSILSALHGDVPGANLVNRSQLLKVGQPVSLR